MMLSIELVNEHEVIGKDHHQKFVKHEACQ